MVRSSVLLLELLRRHPAVGGRLDDSQTTVLGCVDVQLSLNLYDKNRHPHSSMG
jgi:hypothetical protein